MEAVHILPRVDRLEHALRVHLRRQRQLHQNAVDFLPRVQAGDQVEELLVRGRRRPFDLFAVEAERLGCFHLAADVDLRGGILPHQNRGQARRDARSLEIPNLPGEFRLDLVSNLVAVKNARAQSVSPSLERV